MTQVAFLGLGAMGLPMALNVQRKGFAVTAWNRTAGKGGALAEAGGRVAETPADAVAGAAVVVTMLADPAAVRAVAEQFLPVCAPGDTWVDASTIGPAAAREMAELAARYGVDFVDAPVLGSVGPAAGGTLGFLAGGTPEAVERVRPVLEAMGTVRHMGPAGAGAAAKVVSNMVTGTLVAAVGEGLALSERLGLDMPAVLQMLLEGPVSAPIVKGKAPLMLSGQFTPAFQLKWMEKDLGLALREAHELGASLPAAAGAHADFAGARAAGLGEQDFAAVGAFLRRMAVGPR